MWNPCWDPALSNSITANTETGVSMQSHYSKPARVLCCTSSWLQGRHGRRSGDVGRCMGHHATTEPVGRDRGGAGRNGKVGWLAG